MAREVPDDAMMAVPHAIARFIAMGDEASVQDVFSDVGTTIIENFSPFLFAGPNAVDAWVLGMRDHAEGLEDLRYSFGDPQDFSVFGDQAFFTLPTTWQGTVNGVPFYEEGGWAFLLVREGDGWRLRSYGWAVTHMAVLDDAE